MIRSVLTFLLLSLTSPVWAQSGQAFFAAGCQVSGTPCGTAAIKNTGTSGNTIPLLDGANVFSLSVNTNASNNSGVGFFTDTGSLYGIARGNNNNIFYSNGAIAAAIGNGFLSLPLTDALTWSASSANITTVGDVSLYRDAAGILAQRDANNGQILHVGYNWTDSGNYSWGMIDAGQTTANTLYTGSRHVGSPTQALTKWCLQVDATDTACKADYNITTAGSWTFAANTIVAGTTATSAIYDNSGIAAGKGGELLLQHVNSTPARVTYASVKGYAIGGTAGAETGGIVLKAVVAGVLTDKLNYSVTTAGVWTSGSPFRLSTGYTVATLPAAAGAGARAYVTDQLTACAGVGVALTGGGAVVCPAFYNGAAWVGG